MIRSTVRLLAGMAIVVAVGCSESTSPSDNSGIAAAFLTTPAGFSATDNTFPGSGDAGQPWMPDRSAREDNGAMMGGGLGPEFSGDAAFGRGWNRGPFGVSELLFNGNCTFSSTTGRVTCPDVTRRGLTISRSFQFMDASGTVQAFPNVSTNTINEQVSVTGTVKRDEGDVTATVDEKSDRTVGGLAPGAIQRTVNGWSKGTENSSGTRDDGTSFTATRLATDTTTGLVIPLQDGRPTFPTAGRIVRLIQATVTVSGKSPVTRSREEIITYDGSTTAKVVIIKNGVTKNCTLALPHGRLNCQ